MKQKTKLQIIPIIIAAIFFLKISLQVHATPYASGITNDSGLIYFFLNEDATNVNDGVKVIFDGGTATNDLGTRLKGRYSFSLGAHTTYAIQVTKSSAAGWKSTDGTGTNAVKLQISSSTNRNLNFENPRGIEVNRNPSSPYFGRIYASNSRTNLPGLLAGAATKRPMGIGLYMINPDQTSAHAAGQEDTVLRPSGWPLALNSSSSVNTFPYEITIGPDDNIYVSDWTDSTANLWVTDPNVTNTAGTNVLKQFTGASAKVPVGIDNTHGSINAAHVEGSLAAGNLTVWTIDEDLQTDPTQTTTNEVNSLWRYNVNGDPLPNTTFPTKVWTASGKQGIAFSPQTMDMVRSTNGNFYIVTSRGPSNATNDVSGLAVVSADGTPLWNSYDASQAIRTPGTDFLTNSFKVALSPDDKYVAVARTTGFIWIIPLVDGIPNLTNRTVLIPFGNTSSLRGMGFDAAGNLYVCNNSTELLAVFSPGGTTVATTSNDATGTNGSITISAPATTVSVTASTPTITENGGVNGVFTISRVGDTGVPLTVPYTIGGTATIGAGNDYTMATGSVTIAAFQSSTNIAVTPLNDSLTEFTETVTLTLGSGSGYSVGSSGSATVSILDDEPSEISFVSATPKTFLEGYATSKATYQLVRRGLLSSDLTVNLSYSGTATVGVDFGAPASVNMGSNVVNANITLTSMNDQNYEGDETATVTVTANGYAVGAPASANATIIDDETPVGTVLFHDEFETNSASNWNVYLANNTDAFVDFAWDYGTNAGIPPAPGSTTTLGMRFRCGNTILITDGLSVSPVNGNFTGDYRLKFDMWINYNGPLPDGGPGSTQNFDAGVGTTGDHVVWANTPDSDGVWFSATGDGAAFDDRIGDYSAFIGTTLQTDDSGVYAAGTNAGVQFETDPYYAYWGGVVAPPAQLTLYPGQTGIANTGNAGMAWHSVVLTKISDTVTWIIDGITIATVTNTGSFSTNIFVGYQDLFASGSLSNKPEMSFGLVDNLRVETLSAPSVPFITGIEDLGSSVRITFTAGASDLPGSFKLLHAALVTDTPVDTGVSISSPSAGVFQATVLKDGNTQFYRISR